MPAGLRAELEAGAAESVVVLRDLVAGRRLGSLALVRACEALIVRAYGRPALEVVDDGSALVVSGAVAGADDPFDVQAVLRGLADELLRSWAKEFAEFVPVERYVFPEGPVLLRGAWERAREAAVDALLESLAAIVLPAVLAEAARVSASVSDPVVVGAAGSSVPASAAALPAPAAVVGAVRPVLSRRARWIGANFSR